MNSFTLSFDFCAWWQPLWKLKRKLILSVLWDHVVSKFAKLVSCQNDWKCIFVFLSVAAALMFVTFDKFNLLFAYQADSNVTGWDRIPVLNLVDSDCAADIHWKVTQGNPLL